MWQDRTNLIWVDPSRRWNRVWMEVRATSASLLGTKSSMMVLCVACIRECQWCFSTGEIIPLPKSYNWEPSSLFPKLKGSETKTVSLKCYSIHLTYPKSCTPPSFYLKQQKYLELSTNPSPKLLFPTSFSKSPTPQPQPWNTETQLTRSTASTTRLSLNSLT